MPAPHNSASPRTNFGAPANLDRLEPPHAVGTYSRNHNVNALSTVTGDTLLEFDEEWGRPFSKLKYGEPASIEFFASKLADAICRNLETSLRDDPESWRLVFPAYRNAPTSAVMLAEQVKKILKDRLGFEIPEVHLERNTLGAGDFGALTSRKAREEQIFGNFFYRGPSLRACNAIFIEDALVSGTHYRETQRVLEEDGHMELKNLHAYFLVDVAAESFSDGEYSVEAVLNNLWVDNLREHRLVHVLQKPGVHITPRMAKLVTSLDWEQTQRILDKVEWPVVLGLYHSIKVEALGKATAEDGPASMLKEYAARRLQRAKDELGIRAEFTLTEETVERFLTLPAYEHSTLIRKLSHGELYSRLKYGDKEAIEYFADVVATGLLTRFPELRDARKEVWSMGAPGYVGAPGSAQLLAEAVASKLDLPIIGINRKDVPESSYGKISDARVRIAEVTAGEYEIVGTMTPHVIVLEDAIVSGANTQKQCALLRDLGISPHPHGLLEVASVDLALEERLNQASFSPKDPVAHSHDLAQEIAQIIRDPKNAVVMRAAKALLSASPTQVHGAISILPPPRLIELANLARSSELDTKERFREGCRILYQAVGENHLTKRSNFEASQHHAQRSSVGQMPVAYEPLISVTNENVGKILEREGKSYSRMKYGDGAATARYVQMLTRAIEHRFGDAIGEKGASSSLVLASTHMHRLPNAARILGEGVARALHIPLADMRRSEIFPGEFGALAHVGDRQSAISGKTVCTNPEVVRGKHVLYIDDAVVSGTHVIEHIRALHAAGAAKVTVMALLDVATGDLSVEKELNFAGMTDHPEGALVEILNDLRFHLTTRAVKLLLRQSPENLLRCLEQLPQDRIFDLAEASELEGYGDVEELRENVRLLRKTAADHHSKLPRTKELMEGQRFSIMLFDYDETLSPTLTPLSEAMMDHLLAFMKNGVEIGIISLQPLSGNGLTENLLAPLKAHIVKRGFEIKILRRLHLLPCESACGYSIDREGLLIAEAPLYNVGLSPEKMNEVEKLVLGSAAGATATRTFLRGGYISLHFASATQLKTAQTELTSALAHITPPLSVVVKPVENRHVLHIKCSGISKAIGRDHMLRYARDKAEARLNRSIERHEVLVVGDRMGTSPGQTDDTPMMVLGGWNVAVGKEAAPGAMRELLESGPNGVEKLLATLQRGYPLGLA